jgi:class 3 adenylate cyclase
VVTCTSCGEENPDRARFCLSCGSPLAARGAVQQAEERKLVTVLFCDLVGFTAASDNADPEDVRARIRPYHARLKAEIEAYGGTVEKFIGDAVMAVFGAPVAHEDDPERAVRAGLRVLESIEDLNQADPSLDLSVRVGIATGEALVVTGARPEQGEGMVTGDVVNTASRLQGAAPVGGVVVNHSTFLATQRIFEYLELDPVVVKGKVDPVSIYQAMASRARFGTDVTRTFSAPLAGRELERGLLTSTFERCVRDSSVHLVTIVGEPGVGKSRLVAELFSFVDGWPDLVTWRQGRCLPYGDGITFWALGEILKAEAGILETDDPEAAASKIDDVIPDSHPDAPWLRQRLRPLVGLEAPQADKEEKQAAWRTFLESLAERNPTVIVLEDLHWADQALLEFVDHVVEYASGVPLLLLATARPDLYERAPMFVARARNATRIDLVPLSEQETARLIGNLLQTAVLPTEVQRALLDRSGGNPLYAEEFVRFLKDTGALRRTGNAWTLDPGAQIPVPSSVQGIIAARLDTLGRELKALLQDASVIGKVFWSGALAFMGDRDPHEVEQALHDLARSELIRPARRSSMEHEREYDFSHALIKDVCYEQIPRAARAQRHVQAASWIEQVASGRVEDHAEIVVSHYTAALELATALGGTDTADLRSKAVMFLGLAGDRALGIDVEAAESHYARALDLMSPDDPDRPDLLLRHGTALMERARLAEAAGAIQEAIEGLRRRGTVTTLAAALCRYSQLLGRLGRQGYRDFTAEAVALLAPLGPSPELVAALAQEAGIRYILGEARQAVMLSDQGLAMAAQLGLPEPARALGFRGAARAEQGDSGGLEDLRKALELAETEGLSREAAVIRNNLGEVLWPIEGPRANLESRRAGSEFARSRGMESWELVFEIGAAEALVAMGLWDEATTLGMELMPRLVAARDAAALLSARSAIMTVLTRRGDYREATPLANGAVPQAREVGQSQTLAYVLPAVAELRLGTGDASEAVALLTELNGTQNLRGDLYYIEALPAAVRTALGARDFLLAARLVDGVEPTYPLQEHVLSTTRALLAESRRAHAEAALLFADAGIRWKRFEVPWEEGQALLGEGRCLLALGRREAASPRLHDARGIFARLGARPALTETDGLIERATARTS